jgi:hypothetical protein
MATATRTIAETEVAILARLLDKSDGPMPPEVASYILELSPSERDQARMTELAIRNQDDDLSPEEKEELIGFAKATSVLSILKSKARRTLGLKLETRPAS